MAHGGAPAGPRQPDGGKGPLRMLRSLVFNIVFWTWTTLLVVLVLPAAPFISPAAMRRYAAFWMRGVHLALRAIVGLTHKVEGLENLPAGPVIIAAKHQSAWETLFFHTVRPELVIGLKYELTKIPLFGWYLMLARNIRIDRGSGAKALRSLTKGAKEAIRRGESILIFPEGTRRPVGAEPDYKPGTAALYKALDVPVVPVALNSGRFWRRRGFIKEPGEITVRFLEPIPPGLDRKTFAAMLENRIETACREL